MNRRNIILNVSGEGLWGVQAGMISSVTVLTVLLQEFGAGKTMIGSISALESGAALGLQFFGLYLFISRRKRRQQVVWWHLFAIVPFIFMIGILVRLASHLSPLLVRWGVLIFYTGFLIAIGMVGAAFMDWISRLYTDGIRGAVLGLIMFSSGVAAMCGSILSGWLMKVLSSPAVFAWIFMGAGVIAALSMSAFWLIDDSKINQLDDMPRPSIRDIKRYIHASLKNRGFRTLLEERTLALLGFCMLPFIAVHYTSLAGGALLKGTVVSAGAMMSMAAALTNLLTGRLGDKHGHQKGLLIGVIAQVVTLLVLLFGRGVWSCLMAYTGAGIFLGTNTVSYYNVLFETCPHDNRFAHITVGNFIIGMVGMVAPILAGMIAARWNVQTLFTICLGFSVITLFWHFLFVRKPPRERPIPEILKGPLKE